MDKVIHILKSLADINRLRIVYALRHNSLCACQLIELLEISGAGVSQHMNLLTQAGVCRSTKSGRWVHFEIIPQPILDTIFKEYENSEDYCTVQEKVKVITGQTVTELCQKQRQKTSNTQS